MNRDHSTLTTRSLRLTAAAALAAAAAIGGGGVAAAHARTTPHARAADRAHAAKGCSLTFVRVHGKLGLKQCGPATASITVGGHRYDFTGGSCKNEGGLLLLSLGTSVESDPKHNAGVAGFTMTVPRHQEATIGSVYSGGRDLDDDRGEMTTSGPGPSGTFKSLKGTTPAFHGSWNCHGTY
jgi:hypothetical protein